MFILTLNYYTYSHNTSYQQVNKCILFLEKNSWYLFLGIKNPIINHNKKGYLNRVKDSTKLK